MLRIRHKINYNLKKILIYLRYKFTYKTKIVLLQLLLKKDGPICLTGATYMSENYSV